MSWDPEPSPFWASKKAGNAPQPWQTATKRQREIQTPLRQSDGQSGRDTQLCGYFFALGELVE